MKEKKYVPNEVFKFRVMLNDPLTYSVITIYTKPLPEIQYTNDEEFWEEIKKQEIFVQSKYFSKEKIEELKEEFIKRIRESENPFCISCVDTDSGYNVTEEQLFDLDQL